MIRMHQLGVIAFAMLLPSPAVFAAPTSQLATPHADPGSHHYIYYPTKRLYFSPETQMWFWPDASSWTSGGALPVVYQQYARGGYNVYLDVEQPYEAQQDVDIGYRHHRWTPYHYDDDADGNAHAHGSRHGRGVKK